MHFTDAGNISDHVSDLSHLRTIKKLPEMLRLSYNARRLYARIKYNINANIDINKPKKLCKCNLLCLTLYFY